MRSVCAVTQNLTAFLTDVLSAVKLRKEKGNLKVNTVPENKRKEKMGEMEKMKKRMLVS